MTTITKAKHFTITKHTIFKEANPWKLKMEAYWAEKGCKTRAGDGFQATCYLFYPQFYSS